MPSLNQLELLELTAEDRRSDIVPVYRKSPLSDEEFRKIALAHLCKTPTLPLDFTAKVKVTSSGVMEGLFGVIKNVYTVTWKIHKGDYNIQKQNKKADFVCWDNVYTLYGSLPEALLDNVNKIVGKNFLEKGVRKAGYISTAKAEFLTKDIYMTRSSPDSVKEVLLEKLRDNSQYEKEWRFTENSAQVTKVVSEQDPSFTILAFNYLDWEYNGMQGTIYYDPTSEAIISENLPIDSDLEQKISKAKKADGIVLSIYTVAIFLLIGLFVFLGIKTDMKWYMCIVWFFVSTIPLTLFSVLFSSSEDHVKSKLEKQRSKARKTL